MQARSDAAQIQALQQTPTFGGLDADAIRFLLQHARRRELQQGEQLYAEGDPSDCVYLVESGEIRVSKPGSAGSGHWNFTQGGFFGDISLIAMRPRACRAEALRASQVLQIDAKAFHEFYNHDSKQYTLLMMNIGRNFSRLLLET